MNKKATPQLIAAVYTPFTSDQKLNCKAIAPYAAFLADKGISGVFVCGTTGEGLSLTVAERKEVAEEWVRASAGRMRVFVHVGHESLAEARHLAEHAQSIKAGAIATIGPVFFKPRLVEDLVDYCAALASAAPDLPFYYYHIPVMTGLNHSMLKFLDIAAGKIPTLAGIKFTDENLMEFTLCAQSKGGRFDLVFGRDEILLAALALGARGAIGSTYNYFAPVYQRLIDAFEAGNLGDARKHQLEAMKMIEILVRYGGLPAGKLTMRFLGIDCGPVRPPLRNLSAEEASGYKRAMEGLSFFADGFQTGS